MTEYDADVGLSHDQLAESLRSRKGWDLYQILELKTASKDCPSLVTLVWQRKTPSYVEREVSNPNEAQFTFSGGRMITKDGVDIDTWLKAVGGHYVDEGNGGDA